jgi:class 3 adenylate cyclase/tetratricopeptide (TPR) repeat protein
MKCPDCHTENSAFRKFCRECGAILALVCPKCGTENLSEDKFCGKCGQKLDLDATSNSKDPASEGERKHVTVLFSDLSGYTAMSERLDPEDVKEITGKIYSKISRIVGKYDGFIEKYAGDAVMALFGASQSHEDDPVRAVKAAQEIHRLVESMGPQYEEKVGQRLLMHTGINTGLVVTGELNLEKGVHGVAGDAVNVASRLSSIAAPGDILIGPDTYSRAEGFFNFESLEPTEIKGKAKPVPIYKYLSSIEQPRKIHRLHGLRAELIGRKAEMAQLSEAIDNLANGQGSVFSIIGPAGTGKSRLIEELKGTLNLDEIQWREGHAYAYTQNTPYFPLINLINRTLQIKEGDSPETIKEKIDTRIAMLMREKSEIVPYIGSLYALKYPEIEEASPEYWKMQLQKSILIVLSALAQRAPTVICFEDLHWADPSTVDLVRFLLSEIKYPVIFVCIYRPLITLFSGQQIKTLSSPYSEIQLQDLSVSEAQKMVESLLKTDRIPPDLKQFMQQKVEGNPFYLEEAINSLIDSNALIRENGSWKVIRPITESEISATIHGVISARVDRLERESKRILQEASVIGRSFYYEILKRVTELKQSIDKSLSGLERLDLIKTKAIQPDLEYIFKHALTQEVVYNGLLKKERREIHEHIGMVMEQLFQERLPEFYETLAFHFKQGRSFHKAIDYLMKSGEKSIKRYAVEESNRYYKEAFELLINKSDRLQEEEELLIELFAKWALVFYYRGDFKKLTKLLLAHEDLAARLNDKAKAGMFYVWLGFSLFFRGKLIESYRYLCRALVLGEEVKNQQVIGYACTQMPWTCALLGQMDEAIAHGERAQEISRLLPEDQYLFFKSLAALGFTYYFKGDKKKLFDAGITLLDYGRKHSNIRCTVMGNWMMTLGHQLDGDFQSAVDFYEKIGNVAVDPYYSMMGTLWLGVSYFLNSQFKEAEGPLNEFVNYSKQMGCEILEYMALMFLGIITIAKGHMSQGLVILKEVQQAFLDFENHTLYAQSEYVLGNVYLQIVVGAGPKKLSTMARNIGFIIKNAPFADRKAEAHFKKAIGVARKIGAKGFLAQAYLDLGYLHKAKKRIDKAKECFSEAIQIFKECEMEGFLKQAREALASLK